MLNKNFIPPPDKVLGKKNIIPSPDEVLNSSDNTEKSYLDAFQGINQTTPSLEKENKLNSIISGITDISEGEKQTIKKLAEKGIDKETLSNSILTFQGKHPKQAGENIFGGESNTKKHYYDEYGVPHPLGKDERPPQGYNMASIWGNQEDANNDSKLTTLGKQVFNILPSAVENLADMIHLPYVLGQQLTSDVGQKEFLSGMSMLPEKYKAEEDKLKEADWYKGLKSVANRYKTNTSEKTQESFLNTENINKISDIAKADNWNFTADNIVGTIGQLTKSVGEFMLGGELTKGVGLATKESVLASSYMTQFGDVLDEAKKSGLNTEDAYKFASIITVPLALVDIGMGVEGKIFKDQLAAAEKKKLINNLVSGFIKDTEGKITKESLDEAFNATIVANTSLAKTWLKETGKTTLGEGGQEALQSFIQKAGEQIHDKLSTGEDAKFGTNSLSAQSFAEYLKEGIAGLIGGVPGSLAVDQIKQVNKDVNQSNSILELLKKGDEAVDSFKKNIVNEVQNGSLTKEQGDNALLKVESYNDYNRLINNKGLNFDDEQKKEVFDKTFQKENLESRMKTMGDINKLNPIDLAEYNGFHKQSNDLQKDLNELILKSQIKKETTAAKKTINDIAKSEEKPSSDVKQPIIPKGLSALYDKYKKESKPFEDTTAEDFNKNTNNARDNFAKTVDFLEKKPDEFIYGNLTENPFTYNKPNETYAVELPDGKKIRFSSSMTRDFTGGSGGFKGHFRQEHFSDKQKEELMGHPMAMKLVTIPAVGEKTRKGKDVLPIKAIKIVRADNGKFIGWAKATNTGSTDVSEEQGKLLEDEQFKKDIPPAAEKVINTPTKPLPTSNVQTIPTKEQFVADQLNNLLTDKDADIDQDLIDNGIYQRYFENQYNKTHGKTTNTQITNQEESTTANNKESVGDSTKENKGKEITLKNPRAKPTKIKDVSRRDDLLLDVYNVYDKAMQYFIGGGKLNSDSFRGLYQTPAQIAAKTPLGELKGRSNYVSPDFNTTIKDIAHQLWLSNSEISDDTGIWENAVEAVLNNEPASLVQMAENLLAKNKEYEPRIQEEQIIIDVTKDAESTGDLDDFTHVQENLEQLPDNELENLSKEEKWEEEGYSDIIGDDGSGDQFQKKSSIAGDVKKVVDAIRKALPNIKVIYDENLAAAGKLSADGKTITINPNYAGIDTPIHEAGHVLIDAMGYNDPTIQKAIKQLEKSKLWKETKKRYPELNNEMLGKEVLAEAIGREGAGIFEKESNITKFQKLLDKIFQWFKDKLGLERNEARVLAKHILRGEVSDLGGTDTGVEQFQKDSSLADSLREINDILKEDLSVEDRKIAEQTKSNILEAISDSAEMEQIDEVLEANSLEDFTLDELIEVYNNAQQLDEYDGPKTKAIKERIAYYLNENGKEVLRKNEKFVEEEANKKDLSWKDVNFKVLSHMTSNFPELQQLSPLFDEAYFNKISEANTMKRELEKLAKAVIKEHNQKLGLSPQRVVNFFSSDNAKYFNYLDDNGKLTENTSNLSKAQKDLLDYMKDLLDKKKAQVDENGDYIENEILKIDPTFAENFKTEGLMAALSNYFGGGNLADVQISYVNPNTKQAETSSYLDAQKQILSYSKAGLKEKGVGLAKLLAIAYKAKKNSGKSAYGLNYKGGLTNKFDKSRNKDLGYSKDFYKAAQQFIDDYTHVKHMSKFVPIVNSLDYLYSKGYGEVLKKPNAKKWLDEWSQAQIFQTEKSTDPIIDSSLKFLRTLTSQIVMGFNLAANIMNVAIGTYNTWRAENLNTILKGNARLFGKKGLRKQGIDLLKKYNVVNLDVDSNPGFGVGKLFTQIAFAGQKYGEMQIQGSAFLGKLSDDLWNSFEYNNKGELVVKKDINEKDVIKQINQVKNEITDIQGKYSDKDRRNFARGEFGKNLAQFKTWMPDWWKERFGAEYIDGNGNTKRGTWNLFTKDAIKELKNDFSKENNYGFVWEKGKLPTLKNEQVASNLKGAMAVAFMIAMTWGDDEDKKKRKQALSMQNALGNLLFVFDIDQMKYTIKNPIASIGTINKFIEILDDVIKQDSDEFMKDGKKLIPYNKVVDVPKQVKEIVE